MMLHRHFEKEAAEDNITRQSDLNRNEQETYVSEVFPPEQPVEKPKRGRPKKSTTN